MRISDWSSDVCSSDLTLGLRIGTTVAPRELVRIPEQAQTDYLRVLTYSLGTDRKVGDAMGARTLAPLATRCDAQLLVDEVATLSPYRLLEAGEFELYLAPASQMPRLLEEFGDRKNTPLNSSH